jgi:hypothetical protein
VNEPNPFLELLAKLHIPDLALLMGCVRLLMKWVSGPAQQRATAWMAAAATGPDAQEERDWETILGKRWYRVTAFALDLVLSIKLPTLADFLKLKNPTKANEGNKA